MRRSVWIKATLFFVVGFAAVDGAMARVQCERVGNIMQVDMVLNVQELDVGPKVAVGSEVYSQEYRHRGNSPGLECMFDRTDEAVSVYFMPSNDSVKVPGDFPRYRNIYKTNVDGLGVAFINSSIGKDIFQIETLKMSRYFEDAKTSDACKIKTQCALFYLPSLKVVLVKVGSVKSGRINDIPNVIMYSESGVTLQVFRLLIKSNVSIVSKTCLANPVEVNMGGYSTRAFTDIGSTTPSKDFSIELTNCPAFNGLSKSTLKFRIDPALPAINASHGVLRLDASASTAGTRAAMGVGVQIVTTKDSPLPLGKDQDSGLTLRNTEASYSIPLRARFLQTDSKVTPGPAKATANFTIIYQ
ncbi:type 1 fimbrial protein [Pseudomonas sp. MG-9]|uniref:fimbrial protein n=1 Tax=Pseudomonas sp. MG-9 TaxID=2839032 RepID=UPI001C006C53|nr:fimbrial protein [Pseudomonas sp. MG-9]MBT9266239.1 type 1 fimbrial protein [Pseudomonas sp. MG-9]